MISIASFLTAIRLWLAGQFNKAGKRNELSLFPSPIATRCRCRFTSKSEVAEWEQSLCSKPEVRTKKNHKRLFKKCFSLLLFYSHVKGRHSNTSLTFLWWTRWQWLFLKAAENLCVTVIWHLCAYTRSCLSLESGSEYQFPTLVSPGRYYTLPACQLGASFVTRRWSPELWWVCTELWWVCKVNCGAASAFLTLGKRTE